MTKRRALWLYYTLKESKSQETAQAVSRAHLEMSKPCRVFSPIHQFCFAEGCLQQDQVNPACFANSSTDKTSLSPCFKKTHFTHTEY